MPLPKFQGPWPCGDDFFVCTVTPIEFTIPDDGRLTAAIRHKADKYAAAFDRATPCAPYTAFRPVAVVAIGTWGTVHPSTVSSLVRLGLPPEGVVPVLRKAVKILARHAVVIARGRFAAARRGMPTAE